MPFDFTVRISSLDHVATYATKRGWSARADGSTLFVGLMGGSASVRFETARGVVHFASASPLSVTNENEAAIRRRMADLNSQVAVPGLVLRDGRVHFVSHAILDDDHAMSELTLDRLLRRVVGEVGHVLRLVVEEPPP